MHIGILSRGPGLYSTQRLKAAAEARGHEVTITDHAACSLLIDEYGGRLYEMGEPVRLADVYIPRIGASITSLGVSVIGQLDMLGVPHTTTANGLLLARDKMRCLQFLAGRGVKVPNTLWCTSGAEAKRVAKAVGPYPVVVKLLESTHGVGVTLAHNRYQLERTVEAFLSLQERVIIQEFIEEAAGVDLRAFVVDGKIVAAMERRAAAGEFRANLHLGGEAKTAKLSYEEERTALDAARMLGLDVAGVDLIRSERGSLIMEVNASPGLEGIENCTKVDIAGAIVEAAECRHAEQLKRQSK
ncbi:30S ribosomal protein S6--L-glutamate ligase [Lewinellaceae bacterium SD302]|nr:30S ribosomal protein S6--L-glutamate ligase [Lewinellaceae bacterium SD302]